MKIVPANALKDGCCEVIGMRNPRRCQSPVVVEDKDGNMYCHHHAPTEYRIAWANAHGKL